VALLVQGCTGTDDSQPEAAAPVAINTAATVEAQVAATIAAISAADEEAAPEPTAEAIRESEAQVAPTQPPAVDPNPPLTLPFSDSFDGGINSAWRIVNGSPVVSDGKLGAARSNEVTLDIGNTELRDYTIEFTVSGNENSYWGGSFSDLHLVLSPILQVKFHNTGFYSRAEWLAFSDNAWERVVQTEFEGSPTATLRVVVSGNSYQVFANGQIVSELVYGSVRETGAPLVIRIVGDQIWVDDFSIR